MSTPCGKKISAENGLSAADSEQLLLRMKNLAELRAKEGNIPVDTALEQIAGEIKAEEKLMGAIRFRNSLLTLQAKRNVKAFARRFPTVGQGLLTLLEGSSKLFSGARKSVDAQAKALHGKYFGRMIAELEEADLLKDFKNNKHTEDIFREMGAIVPGKPMKSVTGNEAAFKIAQIVEGVTDELVARQNRAGAFIRRREGYITRQTHDQAAIRALGKTKKESYDAWSEFTFPLLDVAKTFHGADPKLVMRNVHEGLYTGIHGPAIPEEDSVHGLQIIGSLADKVSEERILHFKDADSAFKYNQAFGTRNFRESIMNDIHQRARSIALMENLGPNPEASLRQITRELQEEARLTDDAGVQVDSLRDWKIQAAFNEITGKNEIPGNPTLNHIAGLAKVMLQMAKMGAVTLSSFADKAFLQAEMAYQGISHLDTLVKQVTGMAPRHPEQKRMLRLMGVAMDGLIGNALTRYSSHSTMSGWAHEAQRKFFDLNMLNLWTDANKATAGQLMAAHLGEHASMTWDQLPGELTRVLALYDISRGHWDAMRRTAWADSEGGLFITPDKLADLPDETLIPLVEARGLKPTAANILRERDYMDTALRSYFTDRIDFAVPTPGAAERKWATMDTQAGTPLGEAIRLLMLFKSFPITILSKIVGRNIHGNGAMTVKDWFMRDHRGKFNLAMLMAMGTAAGYISGAMRDALKGRSPKPLILEDGSINVAALNDAAIRGGTLGILGDVLLSDYDRNFKSFTSSMAGPIFGQLDTVAAMKSTLARGEDISGPAAKFAMDNMPMMNLFYVRPVLDYFILWNLEEMLNPGTLRRREAAVMEKNRQGFFYKPSETVNQ